MHIRISKTVSILPYLAQRQISNALSRQRKVEIAALWRRLYSVCRHNGVIEASFPRTFDRDGSNFQSVPPADDKAVTNCVISSKAPTSPSRDFRFVGHTHPPSAAPAYLLSLA